MAVPYFNYFTRSHVWVDIRDKLPHISKQTCVNIQSIMLIVRYTPITRNEELNQWRSPLYHTIVEELNHDENIMKKYYSVSEARTNISIDIVIKIPVWESQVSCLNLMLSYINKKRYNYINMYYFFQWMKAMKLKNWKDWRWSFVSWACVVMMRSYVFFSTNYGGGGSII